MTSGIEYSRPQASADKLGDMAEDRHRFLGKRVLLTGEPETLATANGAECLLSSLRLLVRVCPNVHVALPASASRLQAEAVSVAAHVAFGKPVEFLGDTPDYAGYDAVLSVGLSARSDLPWTVINSNGWVARVSSGAKGLSGECGQVNPVGALGAACLGVAEVFKRLIKLRRERGILLDGVAFSFYSYKAVDGDPGPELPMEIEFNFGIVGAGAIGNGIIYLLSRLPVTGSAWVVDMQDFNEENLGTCLLIGPADLGEPKAALAASHVRSNTRLEITGYKESLEIFSPRIGHDVHAPKTVVCGLDSVEARHEVQGLWPDLIVDGAISDFGCQVSLHPWDGDVACLLCVFRRTIERSELKASRATGLSEDRSRQALSLVTEADVEAAPSEKKDWLRARIGRQICSVVSEGVTRDLSEDRQREGFEPSVPFVACLSSCMVVGELIKAACGWPTPLEPRFQFDVLRGPASGEQYPQGRRSECVCSSRRPNIEDFRRRRAGRPEAA